jgi:ribosome maturation factor RimP
MNIEEKASAVVSPLIIGEGYRLWDVLFEKEGAEHVLRILFEKADGSLDIGECERLTPVINALLDRETFMRSVDVVEIGSPGLGRQLRREDHFAYAVGKPVFLRIRGEKGKSVAVEGALEAFDENTVTVGGNTYPRADILKICLNL